jgi:glycerol-3-phosphate dehydrogenase (NAD(P)+)
VIIMENRITIIGGGSWGTAIAQLLSKNNYKVLICLRDEKNKDSINYCHLNKRYFPEYELSLNINATCDLEKAVKYSSYIVLAVPTHASRSVINNIRPFLNDNHIFIITAKGIEEDTYLRNSEIIKELTVNPFVILSGPTHAEEVIKGLPSAAVIAADNKELAKEIQYLFMTSSFRVYTNTDVIGVELSGAVKNIIALASGIADGLNYGDNTKAALITRGLSEMRCLGQYLGGKTLTFSGLAGLGDLIVTCTSMHSRNRRFGIEIGKGNSFDNALKKINQVVEGVKTTRAIYNCIKEKNINVELPITNQVYQVLFNNKDPLKAVNDLMLRDAKHEIENCIK